jgi:hypothetical protein
MKNTEKKTEKIINLIQELLNSTCPECGERQNIAQLIIIEATIWGASTTYEGIGILEESKQIYKEICEDVLSSSN